MCKRAVITGIGVVSPVGSGVRQYWSGLTSGKSGIGPITLFDTSGFKVRIGGEVKDVEFDDYIDPKQARRMPRASKLAVVAAKMAIDDAGFTITDENRDQVDVIMGVACPDCETLARNAYRRRDRGGSNALPLMPSMVVTAAPTGNVSIFFGIAGESTTVSTGCSSGTNAIGHALRKIRSGESRVILTGGADAGVQADLVASYACGNGLSTRNDSPEEASRPFEAGRDGQVLSEAAALLVLEEYEHARARDARIYAEVAGYGTSSDCHSMSAVSEDVTNAAKSIQRSLANACCAPDDISYFCAHGTAARVTDRRETNTIKRVFGARAFGLPVSSIKSMTGQPFGASGALQTAACAMGISRNEIPPTINYDDPDPDCDLDYVPNEARQCRMNAAMVYTVGMGGNNAALTLMAC